jgi:hypothetical protein
VARLLRDKAANQSVGYTTRLHVAAWKAYGVTVDQSVLEDLSVLTREKWRPATLSRLSALGARKSDQFDLLEQNWDKLSEYLGGTAGEQFADHCRAAQPSQPTSIACELAYLSRKPVGELKQALLHTRVFVSLLRCTGMRSITAVTLRLDQLTEIEGGALLLKRMERKCGSARNVEKPVYVCVVPHADPELCPIVHIAAFLGAGRPGVRAVRRGLHAQARPGLRVVRHHGPAPLHRDPAVRRRRHWRASAVCREEAARVPSPVRQRAGQHGSL